MSSRITVARTKAVKGFCGLVERNTAAISVVERIVILKSLTGKLKYSRLADAVVKFLEYSHVCIRPAFVILFCLSVSAISRQKSKVLDNSERLMRKVVYLCGGILLFVSVGYIYFMFTESWGNYQGKDIAVLRAPWLKNDISFTADTESLSDSRAASDIVSISIADDSDSGRNTLFEARSEPQEAVLQIEDNTAIESLQLLIRNTVTLDEYALEERAKSEVEFLEFLNQSPHIIQPLLDIYIKSPDHESKKLLRSLLATSGSQEIEQHAIEQIRSGDSTNSADWLALLRDAGIQTEDGRDALLEQLPSLTQSEELSNAILAFTPQVVSASQRKTIIDRLSSYLDHSDDVVRDAAVVSLSAWADSSQAYILEQALTDSSARVRRSALSAAFTSTIQSEHIKTTLLEIMRDKNESWALRMGAHNALANYSLQGAEYDEFYQFHQEQTRHININEVKG